jgi:glucosamine-6-phosphate deaminase
VESGFTGPAPIPKKGKVDYIIMKKLVLDNYDAVSRAAADIYVQQLKKKPDSILGLATGSTPLGLYAELVRKYQAEEIDFSKARSFNLDE